jgi:CubicO group peptidase (beta-lactamase class C family)
MTNRCRLPLAVLLVLAGAGSLCGFEVTTKSLAAAAAYSRAEGGLALRVQQGGRVIFEDYVNGFSADTVHRIYSGTKSFVAVTALLAQQDGLLDLNEPASRTLTEWRGDARRSITINQLLSHTSGLGIGSDVFSEARDQFAAALRVRLISTPGTRFHYGPTGCQAFGEILKRKLRARGRTVEGYIRDRLLRPLDIDVPYWAHDDAGNPLLHAGMGLSAEEWAKFGEFVKNEALGKSKQLISPKLFSILFVGHSANPAYGLSFWLNHPPPSPRLQKLTDLEPEDDGQQLDAGGPRDLYVEIGTSKQRLYIIPSLDLVIVRFGMASHFSDGKFLGRLLNGRLR